MLTRSHTHAKRAIVHSVAVGCGVRIRFARRRSCRVHSCLTARTARLVSSAHDAARINRCRRYARPKRDAAIVQNASQPVPLPAPHVQVQHAAAASKPSAVRHCLTPQVPHAQFHPPSTRRAAAAARARLPCSHRCSPHPVTQTCCATSCSAASNELLRSQRRAQRFVQLELIRC